MIGDFQLGIKFSQIRSVNPSLKTEKVLSEIASNDSSLNTAFQLLSSNSSFVQLLTSTKAPSTSHWNEINDFIVATLSPSLAIRAKEFLKGFHSTLTSPAENDLPTYKDIESGLYDSQSGDSSDSDELATTFAMPSSSLNIGADASPDLQTHSAKDVSQNPPKIPYKIILLVVFIMASCFSIFKIKALCEPLGICESSENLDDNADSKQTESSSSEEKSPIVKPTSENSRNVSPELNNTNVKDSNPSVRSQPPSSAPSPLLDRDEPLW